MRDLILCERVFRFLDEECERKEALAQEARERGKQNEGGESREVGEAKFLRYV